MSIIAKTPRIKLHLYAGNSIMPQFMRNYNADMAALDTYIGTLEDSLTERMDTLEQSMSDLTELVGTFDGRITTLEECCAGVDLKFEDVEARLTYLEETVESLQPQFVADLRRRLTAAEEKIDTNATAIESLNNDMNKAEQDIAELNEALDVLEGRVTQTETRLDKIESDFEECCTEVKGKLEDLQQQITSNDEDIAALQQRMSDAEDNIEANTVDIHTLATQMRINTSDISELKSRVFDILALIGDLDDLVTSDKTNLVAAINEAYNHGGGGQTYDMSFGYNSGSEGLSITNSNAANQVVTGEYDADTETLSVVNVDSSNPAFYATHNDATEDTEFHINH